MIAAFSLLIVSTWAILIISVQDSHWNYQLWGKIIVIVIVWYPSNILHIVYYDHLHPKISDLFTAGIVTLSQMRWFSPVSRRTGFAYITTGTTSLSDSCLSSNTSLILLTITIISRHNTTHTDWLRPLIFQYRRTKSIFQYRPPIFDFKHFELIVQILFSTAVTLLALLQCGPFFLVLFLYIWFSNDCQSFYSCRLLVSSGVDIPAKLSYLHRPKLFHERKRDRPQFCFVVELHYWRII